MIPIGGSERSMMDFAVVGMHPSAERIFIYFYYLLFTSTSNFCMIPIRYSRYGNELVVPPQLSAHIPSVVIDAEFWYVVASSC